MVPAGRLREVLNDTVTGIMQCGQFTEEQRNGCNSTSSGANCSFQFLLNQMIQDKTSLDALSFSLRHNMTASRIYAHNRRLAPAPNMPLVQAEALEREACERVSRQLPPNSTDLLLGKCFKLEPERIGLIFADPIDLNDFLGLNSDSAYIDANSHVASLKSLSQNEAALQEEKLDYLMDNSNKLHLTLNKQLHPTIRPHSAPIILRIGAAREHLSRVLLSLRSADRVSEFLLIITIDSDGKDILQTLTQLSREIDFIFTRVFLFVRVPLAGAADHSSTVAESPMVRDNMHFLFGLRLAMLDLNYSYAITLDSVSLVSKDFLDFHHHLAEYAVLHPRIMAVTALPEGPDHDCAWVSDKLQGGGQCPANDPAILFVNWHFAGPGSGLTRKALAVLLSAGDLDAAAYDTILSRAASDRAGPYYCLSPCMPRVMRLQLPGEGAAYKAGWRDWVSVEGVTSSRFFAYQVLFPRAAVAGGFGAGIDVGVDSIVTPPMAPSAEEAASRLRLSRLPQSAHRCLGVDWRSRSCHFRRLCLDPHMDDGVLSRGGFVYFANPGLGRVYDAAPMEVALNSGVTSGPDRYGPRWAPTVVEEQIPGDVELFVGGPLVLLTEYNFANPMLLLFDFYLPWFLLLGLFGFDGNEAAATSVVFRAGLRWPLDSSCEHTHRDLCDRMRELFFPGGQPSLLSDHPFFDLDDAGRRVGEGGLMCFESVLVGTGRLSDHCGDAHLHGSEVGAPLDANSYCNVGRAPLFRLFRSVLLRRLGAIPPLPTGDRRRTVVMGTFMVHDNSPDPAGFLRQLPLVRVLLGEAGVLAVEVDFPSLPLREQAALVGGASAYLGICGGGAAVLSAFMSEGSFLFLSCRAMLDYEVLLNHGITRPVYFSEVEARAITALVLDTLEALDHFS